MSARRLQYEYQGILGVWIAGRHHGCSYTEWIDVRPQDLSIIRFATPLAQRLQP